MTIEQHIVRAYSRVYLSVENKVPVTDEMVNAIVDMFTTINYPFEEMADDVRKAFEAEGLKIEAI